MNVEVGMIIKEDYNHDQDQPYGLPAANQTQKSVPGEWRPGRNNRNLQIHTDEEQVGGSIVSIENRLKKQQHIVFDAQGPP